MLKLNKLVLKDFKCFKEAVLNFNEYSEFFADNGLGKSTIIHAIPWILVGKDAFGKTIDNIYPLDKEKTLIEGTEPSGELHVTVNGMDKVFKRTQLDGKIQYQIDGEEVKAGEYKSVVGMIANEKILPALMIPVYFGDNYKWQEQRDAILNNLKIEDTVLQKFEFEDVAFEIGKDGVDKILKKYEDELKTLKTKRDNYTGKRDYLTETLEGVDIDSSSEELVKQKNSKLSTIKELEKSLDQVTPLKQNALELERVISKIQSEHSNRIESVTLEIKSLEREKNTVGTEYKSKTTELNSLTDTCSLCGNKLNEFEMETQKDTIRKAIEEIKLRGISKKEEIESLAAKKLQLESEVVAKKELEELKQINEKIESITDKVDYDRIQLEKEELYKLEEQIKSYESIVKSKNDFQEVTKQLREVMEDYDDTEEIIDAIKQYRTDYAQLVADTLNAKLDKVKIITFYTQKNGEIKETFEISMDGVPYSSLNTAGKVEAGIELIQLLSEALEVNLPILIDNKESVTRKFEVENQVIALSVKENMILCKRYDDSDEIDKIVETCELTNTPIPENVQKIIEERKGDVVVQYIRAG